MAAATARALVATRMVTVLKALIIFAFGNLLFLFLCCELFFNSKTVRYACALRVCIICSKRKRKKKKGGASIKAIIRFFGENEIFINTKEGKKS